MFELFLIVSFGLFWILDFYFVVVFKFVVSFFRMIVIVCVYRRIYVVLILLILCNYYE